MHFSELVSEWIYFVRRNLHLMFVPYLLISIVMLLNSLYMPLVTSCWKSCTCITAARAIPEAEVFELRFAIAAWLAKGMPDRDRAIPLLEQIGGT